MTTTTTTQPLTTSQRRILTALAHHAANHDQPVPVNAADTDDVTELVARRYAVQITPAIGTTPATYQATTPGLVHHAAMYGH